VKVNTLFLSHGGVEVFRCYEPAGDEAIHLKQFWFATSQRSASFAVADSTGKKQFDVRDLSPRAAVLRGGTGKPGEFLVEDPVGEAETKAIIRRAIDEGVLTRDGIVRKVKRFCAEVTYRGVENFLVEARTPAEATRRAREMFEAGEEPTEMGDEEQVFESVQSCEEWRD